MKSNRRYNNKYSNKHEEQPEEEVPQNQKNSKENKVEKSNEDPVMEIIRKTLGSNDEVKNKYNGDKGKNLSLMETMQKVEKKDTDVILSGELADLYEDVRQDNGEFKADIFYKNLYNLNNQIGVFDRKDENISHTYTEDGIEELLNNVKTPGELIESYTAEAKKIKLDY